MRTLNRNKTKVYYANYVSRAEITDSNSFSTLQYTNTYSTPIAFYANVSPANGRVSMQPFGQWLEYDRALVTDDMSCTIAESSILWIDKVPANPYTATDPEHDYVVVGVAKGLNSIAYAVKKVSVS